MPRFSPEDFGGKVDSLYRLVIVCARRASQVAKPDARALVSVRSKKPMMVSLKEFYEGKITYRSDRDDEEGLFE